MTIFLRFARVCDEPAAENPQKTLKNPEESSLEAFREEIYRAHLNFGYRNYGSVRANQARYRYADAGGLRSR